MRTPIKRRTNGDMNLAGLGRAISGLFSGRTMAEAPTEMEDAMAKIQGQQNYYQNSPSSPAIKRKVAIKMGNR